MHDEDAFVNLFRQLGLGINRADYSHTRNAISDDDRGLREEVEHAVAPHPCERRGWGRKERKSGLNMTASGVAARSGSAAAGAEGCFGKNRPVDG